MEELKELFNVETLTDEQKSRVREIAAGLGVDISYVDSGCGTCKDRWSDAIVACYNASVVRENLNTDARYVLRSGVDVLFGGNRVNALNMSDEYAEELIFAGFPPQLFARIDGQPATPELVRSTSISSAKQRKEYYGKIVSESLAASNADTIKQEAGEIITVPETETEAETGQITETETETVTNENQNNRKNKTVRDRSTSSRD